MSPVELAVATLFVAGAVWMLVDAARGFAQLRDLRLRGEQATWGRDVGPAWDALADAFDAVDEHLGLSEVLGLPRREP